MKNAVVCVTEKKIKQTKKREDERARKTQQHAKRSDENTGESKSWEKNITHKNAIAKKKPLVPYKAQLGGGGGVGEGAVLFLVPKKITFTTFPGQLLPNCIYSQF
jgi:hypothetical protein